MDEDFGEEVMALEGFWGMVLEPNQSYQQTVDSSFCVTNATFGPSVKGDGRACVVVSVEKTQFVLASLIPGKIENVPLKVHFTEGQSIELSVTGNNAVHLTGYFLPPPQPMPYDEDEEDFGEFYDDEDDEDDEDDDMYLDEDDDEDEDEDDDGRIQELTDEEAEQLKNEADQKRALKLAKAARLARLAEMEEDDEDDEDDEDFDGDEDEEDEDEEDEDMDDEDNEIIEAVQKDFKRKLENQKGAPQPAAAAKKQAVSDANGKPAAKPQQQKPQQQPQQQQQQSQSKPNTPAKGDAKNAQAAKPATPGAAAPGKTGGEGSKPNTPGPKADEKKPASQPNTPSADKQKQQQQQQQQQGSNTPKQIAGGVAVTDIKVGQGKVAQKGRKVSVRYIGKLDNGKVFDSNTSGQPFSFKLGGGKVIKGWDVGLEGMKVGGERKLVIPPAMAYGAAGAPPDIPKNARLTFEIKLLAVD